jgi:signal peptidase
MAKNIMKIVANVFTGILIAVLCLVIVTKVIALANDKMYSSYFGYTALAISSGSMEPTLNIDDIIVVKIGEKYSVGDIISYIKDGAIITHRIVSVSGNNIIVKGDANNSSDTPISANDVVGKVVKVYPKLKRWKDILSDPKILVGLVITLVLFDFAISYKKKDNKQKL